MSVRCYKASKCQFYCTAVTNTLKSKRLVASGVCSGTGTDCPDALRAEPSW